MTLPSPEERPTLSVEETGRLLGIGRTSMYAAIRAGDIPSIKVGGRVLVLTAELRRVLHVDSPAA